MTEFFAMGGYAAYVWPAYGFAALVLIALLVQSWRAAPRAELEQVRRVARPARASRPKLQPAPRRSAPERRDRRAGDRSDPMRCASNNA